MSVTVPFAASICKQSKHRSVRNAAPQPVSFRLKRINGKWAVVQAQENWIS